jgi:peptidoglycan hydrolase-like protein with peptidoglycan-binding domain
MKKFSIILVLVFVLGFASLAQAAQFDVNLSYGSTNRAEVIKLQEFLVTRGLLDTAPTGSYFNVTKQAVTDFQRAYGISPLNGVFGPATRAVANSMFTTPATPKPSVRLQSVSTSANNTATAVLANYPAGAGVDINLIRKTDDTPSQFLFLRKVATNTANDGQETLSLRRGETGSNIYVEVTCSSTFAFQNGCQLQGSPMKVN